MNEKPSPLPATWRSLPARQQPAYPDAAQVAAVVAELRTRPPLVFAGEVDALRERLAQASRGEAFVLTGGDCAETFAESTADHLRLKIQTILQMAVVLTYGASLPIIKMGRMAGQYAKPRSADLETRAGVTLPSYRGDAVNGHLFTPAARTPDPTRLLDAYQRSATSFNLIRAFTMGGYADLRHVHQWNRGFTANPAYARYEQLAGEIDRAMRFMEAAGVDFDRLRTVDFYSSHEALLLEYEDAMTRVDSRSGELYNTSAHFLWIGERTRELDGAHVEMLRHVRNPLGVKVGPQASADELRALVDKLNPHGEEGRLTFITRMGAAAITEHLPPLLAAMQADGRPVVWVCDPMHGNTISSASGYKTRNFDTILAEVEGFFAAHQQVGTVPGGIHVELTGDDVTEVLGGAEEIDDGALARRYETLVDPRLNHQQSLELAFLLAEMLRSQ
ncbi:class II 3-deoxy-7-phosphoheptulonate synthase [Buchananella hordeovulneris]|uniref:Phospho-2-dehydro-3-deoxyheptonate aldolase n=1 Tax=Buchananella hordeovulneris TaxID=52770 RepID=A0A1Q5PU15_9ACTO|nr:3-deoxy-7-phosphoheptulonate synthase class II [Buchananella hordeovulneris]MDO5080073.1 3-deoxy-7-phosphoheptulonate synthase class II [Buchananella hordeovulneris]OKL50969.1 3-deoxy-7-phosphoheptulonate synthase [Buchananella hordeovulneris]RRD44175.1 3-deoxy-7-phosphoheptulonate synthase class II [Buchananella hordeovulneris]RRD53935.1 3-deoxy-7-phosphoheptulonate synthase class II [Buchananella hordeovulneris]